ncbi:MAG: ABC transporter permease [Saprospiraceae bacterium]|nr:ABC transporter permease [Saprospiraceae bacterium]
MIQFFSLVKKEFYHILRDPRSMFVLFGMPIAQILIFGFALSNEVKDTRIAILDNSKDADTEGVIHKLEASRYFDIERNLTTLDDIEAAFKTGKIKMAVVFQSNFRDNLLHTGKAQVQLIADASDPNTATTVVNYATAIIADYQLQINKTLKLPLSIGIETRMMYNPQMKGEYNFVPGVMAMILMLISAMMTSVAIVREKELGTMEILLVSPMKPLWLVISKMIPYLTLSIVNFGVIVLLSVYVLGLPVRGSVGLLFLVSVIYILCSLALGLMISSVAHSQQVALMISLIGLMMPTILFSGFMFPIENLPLPMQVLSNIVPAKWYFIIVKDIMIKGLDFNSILKEVGILVGMTVFLLAISLKKFKVRLE